MESNEIKEKSIRLNDLLSRLAQSDDLLSNANARSSIYKEFETIYYSPNGDGFRHYYSEIFAKLFEIKSDETLSNGSTETLLNNLRFLAEHYKSINHGDDNRPIDISKSIRKLYDHVNLELARMDYADVGNFELKEHGSTLNDLSDKVIVLQNNAEDIKKSLERAQTDYIAILGIFAAVVLAFIGGMTFSTSVFENMGEVNIYRLLIVSLIIGVVFVTVIFLMFYFIGVLTGRQITGKEKNCPLISAYIFFGILIIVVCIMWCCGTVEKRNTRVSRQSESDITAIIETTETTTTSETSSQVDIMTETADTE